MGRPTYKELERRIQKLEQLVNLKVYPQEVHQEGRPRIYFRMGADWTFDFFDKGISDLTGYDLEDFLDRQVYWLDLIHEEDRDPLLDSIRVAMESDRYCLAEFRIRCRTGQTRWMRMSGPIFCDEDGRLQHIQGILCDITAQKSMEVTLDSEHEVFVWVANSLEDGIYIVSDDYRIQFMNKALVELMGNHVGRICHEALFHRPSPCPRSPSDSLHHEGCGIHQYYMGELGRTFEVRSFPIKTRYGTGKLGKFKDITRTKMLKHKVKHLAVRHQAILDAANLADIGIFRLETHEGIEARFRCANIAFCRITGYAAEELLHMSFLDLIPEAFREEVLDLYRRRQRGEIPNESYERKMVRKDGSLITVNVSVAAIQTTSGRVATIGFLQDVTEREKYQKSLWLSQRLSSIGRVAAEVAHEINNPLTSVMTFNKLVERIIQQEPFPVQRTAELRDYTRYLNAEASRCAEIARNLLEFSRHNEIEIKKEHHIHEILEKTLNILRHRAALTDIRILTSYAEDVPPMLCDFKRLQQAFVNILWNGIEAMPEGGVLSVSTNYDAQERLVSVVIGDTGVGVPEEDLDNIFEPFYTTKAEGKGVGLGLSVAYGIIRQHQGRIHVQSMVGKGTQFTILLPADALSVSEVAECGE